MSDGGLRYADATMTPAETVGLVLSATTENDVGEPVFEALSVPQTVNDFVPCVRPASAVNTFARTAAASTIVSACG